MKVFETFLSRLKGARLADQAIYGTERAVRRAPQYFDSALVCLLVDNAERVEQLIEAILAERRERDWYMMRGFGIADKYDAARAVTDGVIAALNGDC